MESSVILRMLRPAGTPTFLTTSSEKPRMFPKSVLVMNARRSTKSVSLLKARKRPLTPKVTPLSLDEEIDQCGLCVDVDSGSDEDDSDDDVFFDNNIAGDGDAVLVKVEFPGLMKYDVKVHFFKDTLYIRATDPAQKGYKYLSKSPGFSSARFNLDEAKAQMKNGWLRVVVPMRTLN